MSARVSDSALLPALDEADLDAPAPRPASGLLALAVPVVRDAALLPLRLAVAGTQATLAVGRLAAPDGPIRRPGGYAEMVQRVIGEGGYVQQLADILLAEGGPVRLAEFAAELLDPARPLGRMLQRDGVIDRLLGEDGPLARLTAVDGNLERLLAEDGPVDRLLRPDGALERLLAEGGALDRLIEEEGLLDRLLRSGGTLDRLTEPGGVLEQLLRPNGLADRILTDDGFLEKLLADGGTLDQLVSLGTTLEHIKPRLEELADVVPQLAAAADTLGRAATPLGDLAGRIPGGRRRTQAAEAGA
ncbi:hypothetical protein GCM10022215_40440 [Nocardioides fonticola]|uniref:ABC transporter n=1 Tax=Nocardioides fonticola TaxID=450363 RepID=A0ABP7Y0V0_9ACTN